MISWIGQYVLPECDAVELCGGAISEDLLDLEVWPRVEDDRRVVALFGHGENRLVRVHLWYICVAVAYSSSIQKPSGFQCQWRDSHCILQLFCYL